MKPCHKNAGKSHVWVRMPLNHHVAQQQQDNGSFEQFAGMLVIYTEYKLLKQ
jgi:hypothetical protein